jgi:photosystem II stability/assembly factor-like uncharacterized protein
MKRIILITVAILAFGCNSPEESSDSNNSNTTWTNVPFTGDDGFGIYSSCSNGKDLYIGTTTNGIFRSSDEGKTWLAVNNGILDKEKCSVYSFNNVLYATTSIESPCCPTINKIYKSTDNGNSWTSIWDSAILYYENNISDRIGKIDKIGFIDNNIFISIGKYLIKSSDNGKNWGEVFENTISTRARVENILKLNNNIFILCYNGSYESQLFKSTDDGNNFAIVNNISSNPDQQYCSITASNSNLFLGTSGTNYVDAQMNEKTRGVYVSDKDGTNWKLDNKDFDLTGYSVKFSALFYDKETNIIYVGCSNGGTNNDNKVFKSVNNGINWQNVGGLIETNEPIGIGHIFKLNNTLFLITSDKIYKCIL